MALVVGSGLLVGCKSDPVAEGGACQQASECAAGLECKAGLCAKPAAAPEPPPPGLAPIREAKESEKTAQDGLDKRADDALKEAQAE